MLNTKRIAKDYALATLEQAKREYVLNTAFQALCSENTLFGLTTPIQFAYFQLVEEFVGPSTMDHVYWWIWAKFSQFTGLEDTSEERRIDGVTYHITEIDDFDYFWELIFS